MQHYINSLPELKIAADKKQSVIGRHRMFHRPFPAAFIINMSGTVILQMFNSGLWVYVKGEDSNGHN